ncbi:MAG TPA: CPBP family intramembrane glutamic endopeptidase [Gaiellaceae bacterium]|nr:CPBP family intramembrane glutamic endopeptidase [Gaiellaceae bacterium]
MSAGQRLREPRAEAGDLPARDPAHATWRLAGWTALIVFMSAIAYASRLSSGSTPNDVAYRWSTSILGLVQYAVILGILLLITLGLDRPSFLAFRRPTSWKRAAAIGATVLLAVLVVGGIVDQFANPEREQGLIPEHWDSSKIAPFVGFTIIVVVVAPIVEELQFRGVGYGLLERFGSTAAILLVGLAFALVHGLIAGFPVIFVFGCGLAYLRSRTDSIYPCMLLHACFNAFGLIAGIAS